MSRSVSARSFFPFCVLFVLCAIHLERNEEKSMSDLTHNFASLGDYGPYYSGEESHAEEWYFVDLDQELAEGLDVNVIGRTVDGSQYGVKVRNIDDPGQTTYIANSDFSNVKYGIKLWAPGDTYIYNITINGVDDPNSRYGSGIQVGTKESPATGITYVKNVVADGKDEPLSSYSTDNNHDFLTVEPESGPVYVKYVTAENFADGIISTPNRTSTL